MLNIISQSSLWGAYGFSRRAAIKGIVEFRMSMGNSSGKGLNAAKRAAKAHLERVASEEKAAKRQRQYEEMCR